MKEFIKLIIENNDYNFEKEDKVGCFSDKKNGIEVQYGTLYTAIDVKAKDPKIKKRIDICKNTNDGLNELKVFLEIRSASNGQEVVHLVFPDKDSIKIFKSTDEIMCLTHNGAYGILQKKNKKMKINAHEWSSSMILEIINDAIINAYHTNVWQDEIEDLLDLIKPIVVSSINDIKNSWTLDVFKNEKQVKKEIDTIEKQIAELKEIRNHYAKEYVEYKMASDILLNNEQEKTTNHHKK